MRTVIVKFLMTTRSTPVILTFKSVGVSVTVTPLAKYLLIVKKIPPGVPITITVIGIINLNIIGFEMFNIYCHLPESHSSGQFQYPLMIDLPSI